MMVDEIPEELLPVVTSLPRPTELGAIVYPNPTKGLLQVQLPEGKPSYLEIYNLAGRLIHSHHYQQSTIPIDLSGVSKGLYILKVVGSGYQFSEKIIIE